MSLTGQYRAAAIPNWMPQSGHLLLAVGWVMTMELNWN
jgi:hypothetical protein